MVEIGCDGFDLLVGQVVRNRLHYRRGVRFCRILATLFVPVLQFVEDVVRELTGQTRKLSLAYGSGAVTGGARGDVGAGQSVVVDFFSRGNEFIWSGGSEGFWIESRDHNSDCASLA